MTDARPLGADEASFIAVVRSGDAARFALITERHRRELQVHCYRMLANYEDAQDMTQETFLRAWNKRESFKGHAALRTWLYRIATNVCLDFLDKRNDRTPVPSELLYLQPYPDRMLPEDPQESVVARETIELAFIVAVQHLPPRQRAVFILRDVVGWPASKAADALELTVASVTSALFFDNVRVPEANRLPNVKGLKGPLGCLTQARYGITWGPIGAAIACFTETTEYAKNRILFQRPLAANQAVQVKLADMARRITMAQLLSLQLGRLKDAGTMQPTQVSLAKWNNCRMAIDIARECRDILGGAGITTEHCPIRHALNLESVITYEGTETVHQLVVGREVTGINAF